MASAGTGEGGIVVIGRNEGERLIACLQSIRRGADDAWIERLIYVDSGSTDGSIDAVKKLGLQVLCLDPAMPFTAARARNEGLAALRKRYPDLAFVQFVDGDCEIAPGWWEAGAAFLRDHDDAAIVCGHLRERHPERSIYNRLCEIEWRSPVGKTTACGGIAMMRVQAFVAMNGFRQNLLAGEEPEFCVRLRERGWTIWRIDSEMAVHDADMTRFDEWWKRMVRNGTGFIEVYRLHRHSRQGIWKRETLRALAWGGFVPAASVLAATAYPAAVLVLALYPIQIARIALRQGAGNSLSWQYAWFMTVGKFAECWGMCKYALRHARPK